MELNKQLIEKLKRGEIVLENNGTLQQLEVVLKIAFPDDGSNNNLKYYIEDKYFLKHFNDEKNWWFGNSLDELPVGLDIKLLTDFFETGYRTGDEVLASNNGNYWSEKIYFQKVKGNYPHMVFRTKADYNNFAKGGSSFEVDFYSNIKPLEEVTELSLKEVADKFGIPVDKLRIKE